MLGRPTKNEKINILLEQVAQIFKRTVVLKGGTALNKAYLQKTGVDRFSEDIDLDFIPLEKMNLNEKINSVREKINEINGFEISAPRLLHRTLRFDIAYANEISEKDRVRIEFYLSHDKILCCTPPQKQMLVSSFMSANPVMFTAYSFEDLLSKKFAALYSRTEGKDIYDVYHCTKLEYDSEKFNEAMDLMLNFYKIEKDTFFVNLTGKLKKANENYLYIQNSTNHYIPARLRPDWRIMINDLIAITRKIVI
jgi:hypothetical protein